MTASMIYYYAHRAGTFLMNHDKPAERGRGDMERTKREFALRTSSLATFSGANRIGMAVASMIVLPISGWGQSAVWLPPGATTGNIYYNGGNVGIGTTSPLSGAGLVGGLHVFGAGVNTGAIVAETTSDGSYVLTKNGSGGNFKGFVGSRSNGTWDFFIGQYGLSGGNLAFYTDNGGSIAERMRINSSGNVGIGTTSPSYLFDVQGLSVGTALHVKSGGQPSAMIETTSAASNLLEFKDGAATPNRWWIGQGLGSTTDGTFTIYDARQGVSRIAITSAGNVGIGTTNPGAYKLAVEGVLGAREVIVTSSLWADYVFRPGYRLRPLAEVAAYIQQNQHLPDIPSEAEVKNQGISLGEMQSKLLAKVEELTLHMIEADQRNNRLEDRCRELEQQLAAFRAARGKKGSAQ